MKTILFYLSICVCCLSFSKTYAQENGTSSTTNSENIPKKGFKYNNNFDVAINVGGGEFASAFSWVKFHGIGKKQKFKIGYGLRLSNYFGTDKKYTTAPASLINEKKIEEIMFSYAQTNSLNATINLQYSFSQKFEVGFNIDAIGLSFGGEQNPTKLGIGVAKASPTSVNILLVGNNDIGSLNSEFYARYWISSKFAIRAGFSHFFSEYTTTTKLAYNNDRYRIITNLGFIAFTYSPFR
jgi:hypothetical protein